ncbi:unnamed protein product [Strongylus vulgaris]|uniref:SXP/RAL-2 family protein Ani s 5-like cation-binding domain-containing protein n=1 Tax=Strongylus vulgaris TaxID=40348 RepID=A0A3P7IZQ0_STRVU|nr:unnamed protein product [Strongylus vulgaris]
MASLTDEERAAIFNSANDNEDGIPVDDQFDTTPEFIKSLSEKVKNGFDAIWTRTGISEPERQEKLREYARKHFNKEQKEGFESWLKAIIKARQQISDRVEHLPKAAREILEKIVKVREEERQLLYSLTPEMQRLLQGLI